MRDLCWRRWYNSSTYVRWWTVWWTVGTAGRIWGVVKWQWCGWSLQGCWGAVVWRLRTVEWSREQLRGTTGPAELATNSIEWQAATPVYQTWIWVRQKLERSSWTIGWFCIVHFYWFRLHNIWRLSTWTSPGQRLPICCSFQIFRLSSHYVYVLLILSSLHSLDSAVCPELPPLRFLVKRLVVNLVVGEDTFLVFVVTQASPCSPIFSSL